MNEGLESLLRNCAIDLEAGIRNLLGDKTGSWWASFLPWVNSIKDAGITREFYTHPLIRSLFGSETRPPSYVPARNFALALMDLLTADGNLLRGATENSQAAAPGVLFLVDTINGVAVPDSLKKAIDALVTAANGNPEQSRINIESWFNSSMDRVSGWYKSRTQKILFCLGVVIAVGVNADSIAIVRNLATAKNLQAVVSAAEKVSAQPLPSGQDPQAQIKTALTQLTGLDIGLGWAGEKQQPGTLDRMKIPPTFDKMACTVETWPCSDPIGWSLHLLWLHGLGWLISAAALSLGAPFWFDTLNRFIVVRSTVKPKEKSPDEPSKDGGST